MLTTLLNAWHWCVQGVFNADSVWETPPSPLPPVKKNRSTSSTKKKDDFQKPVASSTSTSSSNKDKLPPMYEGVRVPPTPYPPAIVLTTAGLKVADPSAAEREVNMHLTGGLGNATLTFQGMCLSQYCNTMLRTNPSSIPDQTFTYLSVHISEQCCMFLWSCTLNFINS
jgi:hypothetical protein